MGNPVIKITYFSDCSVCMMMSVVEMSVKMGRISTSSYINRLTREPCASKEHIEYFFSSHITLKTMSLMLMVPSWSRIEIFVKISNFVTKNFYLLHLFWNHTLNLMVDLVRTGHIAVFFQDLTTPKHKKPIKIRIYPTFRSGCRFMIHKEGYAINLELTT